MLVYVVLLIFMFFIVLMVDVRVIILWFWFLLNVKMIVWFCFVKGLICVVKVFIVGVDLRLLRLVWVMKFWYVVLLLVIIMSRFLVGWNFKRYGVKVIVFLMVLMVSGLWLLVVEECSVVIFLVVVLILLYLLSNFEFVDNFYLCYFVLMLCCG